MIKEIMVPVGFFDYMDLLPVQSVGSFLAWPKFHH